MMHRCGRDEGVVTGAAAAASDPEPVDRVGHFVRAAPAMNVDTTWAA